jgi:hypothetical protein
VRSSTAVFGPLVGHKTVRLTSYRRDGTPVGTAVSIAVEDGRAFVRTFDEAWKYKRMRRNPVVEVAASTFGGEATGPAVRVHARELQGTEAEYAAELLARKQPILQGFLVPLYHRLRGYETKHFELTPEDAHRTR